MPRLRRVQFAGAIYHVMSRGNRKAPIFEDDVDRRVFLTALGEALDRYGVRCLAYCLMGNHYHLLIETPRGNVSAVMRQLNAVFTQRSNRRHRRTGHVFEGRFRSLVVQRDSYLRRVARYIVRNPVRAGLVNAACAWSWSSYRATAGLEAAPAWLHLEWLCTTFDTASLPEAREKYCLYINDAVSKSDRVELTAPVLGDQAFVRAFKETTRSRHRDAGLPRVVVAIARPPLATLFTGIDKFTPRRDDVIATAHIAHGYRLSEIASFLKLDPSTASKALKRRKRRAGE